MKQKEFKDPGTEIIQKKRKRIKIALITASIILTIIILSWLFKFAMIGYNSIRYREYYEGSKTIAPKLQHAVDSLLRDELEMIDGMQGQVIVVRVQTGEILAISGMERNFEGKLQPCKNFAYQQALGSLTKTASLLALLELGVDTGYVVPTGIGIWEVNGERELRDHNWRRGGYEDINLSRALEVSSNIGISMPIWKFYKGHEGDFFDDLNKMGFGQPENIDGIEGLRPTSYSSPKDSDWVNEDIIWSSIGYNRKIAPIQMLTFYNAIANDGKMVKPTLKTGEVEIINPQIASKANIKVMQEVLEHVVSQGLGRKAGSEFMQVAGKTGTSQVGEYEFGEDIYVDEYQVAFCGYFPADAPKFSMIVSMNKLGLPASGGGMAGALFHDIMEWMIAHRILPLAILDEETNDTIDITEDNIQSAKE